MAKQESVAKGEASAKATTSKNKNQQVELPFETAIERLEDIVRALEAGTLTLDEAMALFQEGVGLSRHCQQKLGEAEEKIDLLITGKDGKLKLKPLKLGENFSRLEME